MKTKLIFDLSKPEDKEKFEIYSNAEGYYNVLKTIDKRLRNEEKYNDNEEAAAVRELLHVVLRENKVGLDVLS